MGKPTGKKKDQDGQKPGNANSKQSKPSNAFDEDTAMFINMSQELKEEGNRLFQKYDHEGAMLKYEKALRLLPKNHIDVAHLHTNMAACYMQMGLGEYPRAIHECNLALAVSPRYSKAFVRRAKCYEALNRLDLAIRDVNTVLYVEPNNLSALETKDGIKKVVEEKGIVLDEQGIGVVNIELQAAARSRKALKEKLKRKDKKVEEKAKDKKVEEKAKDQKVEEKAKDQKVEEKATVEDRVDSFKDKEIFTKNVVEEEKVVPKLVKKENIVSKTVKLVYGEDIRWAQLPLNCSMRLVRDVVRDRFPGLKGVLVKYRDQEGDLVTITTTNELRLSESLCDSQGSLKLYITDVSPDQEPLYDGICNEKHKDDKKPSNVTENGDAGKGREVKSEAICIEDWILQFARLFKNHVGFDSDSYLDLHELGMKIYSEAMEDAVTSSDAQELFDIAAGMFQEMAALALFNWGNVHLSKARKIVSLGEDASRDFIVDQIKAAYEWANKEYSKAEMRYGEALRIKPDFYEGYLALGQQQFEQAKLCWYYAIGSNVDIEINSWSEKVLQHYNKAEDSMEKGMLMWEEMEEQRLNGISKAEKYKSQLQKMGLDVLFKDIPADEATEQAANMKSQIYLLWGTLLYERSIAEYRLGMPTWEECVEVSVEKFELAGASQTDIAVMIKNHCSNETALEGLGFKIDEIVQAWNEMYDAKRWQFGVPSFRLEPLFRRRVPKLHSILEYY